jgi:hypothetical protein
MGDGGKKRGRGEKGKKCGWGVSGRFMSFRELGIETQ